MKWAPVILAAVLAAPCISCSGGSDSGSAPTTGVPPAAGNQATTGVRIVSLQNLPALGPALPPLDEKRVELAPPVEWKVLSRKSGYVARFHRDNMPRILVTVAPETAASLDNATNENASMLVTLVKTIVEGKLVEGEQLLEPVGLMSIGGRPWVAYVRRGRIKRQMDGNLVTSSIEREVLTTVAGGRLYSIELQAYGVTRKKYSNDAYAVAAGMRFLATEAVAPPSAATPSEPESSTEAEPDA